MIRLINIDEKTHVGIFVGILNAIKAQADEELNLYIEDRVKGLCKEAIQQEFDWSTYVYRNVSTFTDTDIMNYLQHLIENSIMKPLGFTYFGETINPYRHLNRIANLDKGSDNKGNFFETNSNAYVQTSALKGYGDF